MDDAVYEITRLLPDNMVVLENVLTEAMITRAMNDLVAALFDGSLAFVVPIARLTVATPWETAGNTVDLSLNDYLEEDAAVARFRRAAIEPLLHLRRRDRTRAVVQARAADIALIVPHNQRQTLGYGVSVDSLYRWIRLYQRSGSDVRALAPEFRKSGGKEKARIDPEADAMVRAVINEKYLARERATINDIVHEVAERVRETNEGRQGDPDAAVPLAYASRSTVKRRIDDLDLSDVFAARHGARAAKRAFSQFGEAEKPTMPLERVEIDHTRSDLIVIDDVDNLPLGRLTLTYCLDVATRYPLGYYLGFEPPSYLAVMECLYHAILPKGDLCDR